MLRVTALSQKAQVSDPVTVIVGLAALAVFAPMALDMPQV